MEENMEKIRVLFIQEKKIKKGKMITLGDLIENEVPDTYQVDYVSAKENILDKVKTFEPKIIFIAQSIAYDIFSLIKKIMEIDFSWKNSAERYLEMYAPLWKK